MLRKPSHYKGFTLTEILVTIAIIGILSSIALPNYFNQMARTRQRECSALLSQTLMSTMAFNDEFSEPPQSWDELNSMVAIMLENGTASGVNNFSSIDLRGGYYSMTQSDQTVGNNIIYTFTCNPRDSDAQNFDVKGCVSLFNGATDIKSGDRSNPAQAVDCS